MKGCKAHGKRVCVSCVLFTCSFPVEHVIWERVPVFMSITKLLGV